MIRGYCYDGPLVLCPTCIKPAEQQAETFAVVLEADDWADQAIATGAVCVRCDRIWSSTDWENQ